MARIPYSDAEAAPEAVRGALEALPELNIFRMLGHAESAVVPYLRYAGVPLSRLELDPQLRELAILLVAARTEAEYEWIQHADIARAIGVGEQQIAAIRQGELGAGCLAGDAQLVLRFTAQLLEGPRVDDAIFAAVAERFPPRQIVELMLVIGNYQTLARIMTTLEIELDQAVGKSVLGEARGGLSD